MDEALSVASLPTAEFPVLFDQALNARITELERELVEARQADAAENRPPQAVAIADRLMALQEEATSQQRVFTFRALPAGGWSDLVAEHPPVSKQDKDTFGFARDAFMEAAVEACAVTPSMVAGDGAKIRTAVSEGVWFAMWSAVRSLNEVPRGPKSVSPTVRRLASDPRSISLAGSDSLDLGSSGE